MKIRTYDPEERAREKARSRQKDDEDLRSGAVSREELQRRNGGGGIFRDSKIVRRPKFLGPAKLHLPEA